jgi:hypothetical protein
MALRIPVNDGNTFTTIEIFDAIELPPISAQAAGAAAVLTTTPTALIFGGANPAVVLTQVGNYHVSGWAVIEYLGATFGDNVSLTLTFRRTNNTPADLADGAIIFTTPLVTTYTGTGAIISWSANYSTDNSDDAITIFASVAELPLAGSVAVSQSNISVRRIS